MTIISDNFNLLYFVRIEFDFKRRIRFWSLTPSSTPLQLYLLLEPQRPLSRQLRCLLRQHILLYIASFHSTEIAEDFVRMPHWHPVSTTELINQWYNRSKIFQLRQGIFPTVKCHNPILTVLTNRIRTPCVIRYRFPPPVFWCSQNELWCF